MCGALAVASAPYQHTFSEGLATHVEVTRTRRRTSAVFLTARRPLVIADNDRRESYRRRTTTAASDDAHAVRDGA